MGRGDAGLGSMPRRKTPRAVPRALGKTNIEGVVRVRPCKDGEQPYITCNPAKGFTLTVSDEYDYGEETWGAVLGPETPQHDVYLSIGLPIVDAVMAGRQACLFAYGQTGSGKTYSMYGGDGGRNPAKLDGAVPAICQELFRRKIDLEKRRHNVKLNMYATLVEVRGVEIIDLLAAPLAPDTQPRVKLVNSDVKGAYREHISSQPALTAMIERGAPGKERHA
jgi:hypothetical protein